MPSTIPTSDPATCLNAVEVCRRLNVSRTTLWRLQCRRRHPIPHAKLGAKIIFPIKAVELWLQAEMDRARAVRA